MKKPRVLFYDIETAPNLAYVWGKYEQDVIAFKKEWEILSIAFKWLGDNRSTFVTSQRRKSELAMLEEFSEIYNKADIVIAHNGDEFDAKKLRSRLVYHNLAPLKDIPSVDTKKVAKKYFAFNSNSLGDLGKHLKLGKKLKHQGFQLWLDCLAGKPKAWDIMEEYNKQDVNLLEKVYRRFKPWMVTHPHVAALRGDKTGCPRCGGMDRQKYGFRASNAGLRQRWLCLSCGGNHTTPVKK